MSTTTDTPIARLGIRLQQRTVAIDKLHPNPWNPNQMDDRTRQAARESIATFGFIDPVTVRAHPELEGHYQIIDGEHRWTEAGGLGYDELPVAVLDVDDATARKLTIIFNETRGEADSVQLGALLASIRSELDDDEQFRLGLRYDDNELKHLLDLADEDWDSFGIGGGDGGGSTDDDDTEWVSVVARMPADAAEVWKEAIAKVQNALEASGSVLHDDEQVRYGQVLELLSAEYLSGE